MLCVLTLGLKTILRQNISQDWCSTTRYSQAQPGDTLTLGLTLVGKIYCEFCITLSSSSKAMKSSYILGLFWDFLCWKLRQVGCYDVAKFRFVNSTHLWINAKLYIVTNLKFATTKHPTFINFLQNLPPRKAWEGNLNS